MSTNFLEHLQQQIKQGFDAMLSGNSGKVILSWD
ncbi:MAG: hypothetical protein ACI87J_001023 [Colwellia sp.]|jgi:hypothetical protein